MTIRVEIMQPVDQAGKHVWVYDERVDGLFVMAPVGYPKFVLLSPDAAASVVRPEPSMIIQWSLFSRGLPRAIAEAFNGVGFETLATANAAELKATKVHLEDMRKLSLDLALRQPAAASRPVNPAEVVRAFHALERAGVCEAGRVAVQDLIKALGLVMT